MYLVSWENAVNRERAELLFQNRNQEYGAYVIRRDYQRNLIYALLYTMAGIVLIFSIPFINKLLSKPPVSQVEVGTFTETILENILIEKPIMLPPSTPQKPVAQMINVPPPVVGSDVDADPPPVIDEIKNGRIGMTETPGEITEDPHVIQVSKPIEVDPDAVYSASGVQEPPVFPGGESSLLSYLSTHIKYPREPIEAHIEGIVYISFVVDKEGKVREAKLIRGIGWGCDEEALRVIKALPDWKPGRQNGRPVSVMHIVPVRFSLK